MFPVGLRRQIERFCIGSTTARNVFISGVHFACGYGHLSPVEQACPPFYVSRVSRYIIGSVGKRGRQKPGMSAREIITITGIGIDPTGNAFRGIKWLLGKRCLGVG